MYHRALDFFVFHQGKLSPIKAEKLIHRLRTLFF